MSEAVNGGKSRDWSGLPSDVLSVVGRFLRCHVDFQQARCVCQHWSRNLPPGFTHLEVTWTPDDGACWANVSGLYRCCPAVSSLSISIHCGVVHRRHNYSGSFRDLSRLTQLKTLAVRMSGKDILRAELESLLSLTGLQHLEMVGGFVDFQDLGLVRAAQHLQTLGLGAVNAPVKKLVEIMNMQLCCFELTTDNQGMTSRLVFSRQGW